MAEVKPTWLSLPSSSYRPSRSEPTSGFFLGIAETTDDAVGRALLFDLDHRPFARTVFEIAVASRSPRRARRRFAGASSSAIFDRVSPATDAGRVPRLAAKNFSSAWRRSTSGCADQVSRRPPADQRPSAPQEFLPTVGAPDFPPDAAGVGARRMTTRHQPG